jgi:hypothetical protein
MRSLLRSAPVAALLSASLSILAVPLGAQTRVKAPSAMLTAPNGRAIGSLHPGLQVRVLETRGSYARVSVSGFVERGRLSAQRTSAGTRVGSRPAVLRTRGAAAAQSVASFDAGTRVSVGDAPAPKGWVRVSREGWVLRSVLDRPAAATASRPPTPRSADANKEAPTARKTSGGEVAASKPSAAKSTSQPTGAAPSAAREATTASRAPSISAISVLTSDSTLSPTANVALRAAPDARALATVAPGATLLPLARERGWVRVRLEGWVPERDLTPSDTAIRTNVSAADLRADPVGTRGKTVRWSVQILATQKADALRRDLSPDETYLLARGPAEENALLYLVVPPSLMATTKSIPELSQAMITARVRTGRSTLVGVPILDLVTITSNK